MVSNPTDTFIKNRLKLPILKMPAPENSFFKSVTKPKTRQKLSEYFNFKKKIKSSNSKSDLSLSVRALITTHENSTNKTYNQEYINKVCQLLKKKDTNYSLKRKNIHKTTYSFDENNNLYLTLPKFEYVKRIRDVINEKNQTLNKKSSEKGITNIVAEVEEHERNHLRDLIPEFFQDNHSRSDDSDSNEENMNLNDSVESELDEQQKKALFEKLRTKKKFYSIENEKKNKFKEIKENNAKIFHSESNTKEYKTAAFQNPSSLFKTSTNQINNSNGLNGLNVLNGSRSNRKKDNSSTRENDPSIQNLRKLNEKLSMLRKYNKEKIKKKKKIVMADVFYYDKKKWEIQRIKESDKIMLRLNEIEDKRKEWNEKNMPDMNLPSINFTDYKMSIQNTNHSSVIRKQFANQETILMRPNKFSLQNTNSRSMLPDIIPLLKRRSIGSHGLNKINSL